MKKTFFVSLLLVTTGVFLVYAGGGSQGSSAKPEAINIAVQSHTALSALSQLFGEFEQKTGIKVIMDESPQDQLSQKILLDLSSGTGAYDVIGIHSIWLAGYTEPGWLYPIDNYISSEQSSNSSDFDYQDIISPEAFNYKGIQYGLPFYSEAHMLFYNKEIFAAAGLPDRAPDNWDELRQFCKTIKEKTGKTPIAMRGIADNRAIVYTWNIFAYSNGWIGWFDNNMNPQFDKPAAIEAAKFYTELLNTYGPEGVASYNWPDVQTLMQQGMCAIVIDASNFSARLEDPKMSIISGKIGYGVVPAGPGGLRKPGTLSYGLYIPKASKHHDAAWKFLSWALSKDVQLKTAINGVREDVTRFSVLNDPKYIKKYSLGNYLEKKAESFRIGIKHYPSIVPFQEVAAEVSVTLNKILVGGDAESLMKELNTKVLNIMKQQ
jgi:ABC-type glycerol-3-phosphate transport system substrate-binding protein